MLTYADVGVPGWVHEYTFLVNMTGDKPILDVTLVWSDPPALPGSETALVNDLDLHVNDSTTVGCVCICQRSFICQHM